MNVAQAFSRAAKSYASRASIQASVARDLIHAFGKTPEHARAIDLGCGSGLLSSALLKANPTLALDCLDLSAGMLAELERNLTNEGCRANQLILADARNFQGRGYDCVMSSSALQWMEPIPETLKSWRKLCNPGAGVGLACMVRGTLGELHEMRRVVAPDAPARRSLPEEEELLIALDRARFTTQSFETREYRLELNSAMELLRLLARTGTASGDLSRGSRTLTVAEIRRIVAEYSERYRAERGGIYATYRALIVVARAA